MTILIFNNSSELKNTASNPRWLLRQVMLLSQCKYQSAASMEIDDKRLSSRSFPDDETNCKSAARAWLLEILALFEQTADRYYSYYFVALEVKNKNK